MNVLILGQILLIFATILRAEFPVEERDIAKVRRRRDTVGFGTRRWPGGVIPYAFSTSTGSQTKAAFRIAINVLQKASCVKFVPRTSQRDYVRVITGEGCYSMIGRDGGIQYLSLGDGCYSRGIAIHETMHLLGFFHEQSRQDRDRHVQVHYYHVHPDARRQFKKYKPGEGNTLGADYDPDSIMHYSNRAFSKTGRETITYRKDPNKRLGQRDHLSRIDLIQLNKLYGCGQKNKKKEKTKVITGKRNCEDDPWTRFSGQCVFHLYLGDCFRHRQRMQYLCPKTCGFCRSSCYDTSEYCRFFASYGYCLKNKTIRKRCKKTCNLC